VDPRVPVSPGALGEPGSWVYRAQIPATAGYRVYLEPSYSGGLADPYAWVFSTWFLGRPEIVGLGGLGGPGGPQKDSRRWGASPPSFGMVFGAAGATQTAKFDDFRPPQKPCMKNPSLQRWTAFQNLWIPKRSVGFLPAILPPF
jgi:hypothetical protein